MTKIILKGKIYQQVQYYEINLKNTFLGVEQFNFSHSFIEKNQSERVVKQ